MVSDESGEVGKGEDKQSIPSKVWVTGARTARGDLDSRPGVQMSEVREVLRTHVQGRIYPNNTVLFQPSQRLGTLCGSMAWRSA